MRSVHTASLMISLHPHSLPLLQHGVPPREVLPELIQHEHPTDRVQFFLWGTVLWEWVAPVL